MDAQLKRGLLDICVLASLLSEDSYGYKIIKNLQPFMEISESTLYPILRRLEGSGCLGVYSAEHNGRLRKYYKINPEGVSRISEFLEEKESLMNVYRYIEEGMKNYE